MKKCHSKVNEFVLSVNGFGKINQDYCLVKSINKFKLIAIADGLGSKKLSHIGAKLACVSVCNVLKKHDNSIKVSEFLALVKSEWLRSLPKNIEIKEFATTLSFCVISESGGVFIAKVGDGSCYSYINGFFEILSQAKIFSNQTSSLSDEHVNWVTKKHTTDLSHSEHLVLMCTDGISDDINVGYEFEFLKFIRNTIVRSKYRVAKKSLKLLLMNWPTRYNNDDKSLVFIRW